LFIWNYLRDDKSKGVWRQVSQGVEDGHRSSVHPSVRSSVRPSVRPSVHLSVCPSVRPFICPSVRPFVRPSVRPSARPPVCPSVHDPYLIVSLLTYTCPEATTLDFYVSTQPFFLPIYFEVVADASCVPTHNRVPFFRNENTATKICDQRESYSQLAVACRRRTHDSSVDRSAPYCQYATH
jgi:hypothetical protein